MNEMDKFIKRLTKDVSRHIDFKVDQILQNNIEEVITDNSFFEFYERINGGFFFNFSLQLFSISNAESFLSIEHINNISSRHFGKLFNKLYAFGCDLFGNLFCISLDSGKIIFFTIETGEREIVAENFLEWTKVLFDDLDYLTGVQLAQEWISKKGSINFNERLCPKIPFITGGEYEVNNLYQKDSILNLKYNAAIAIQIYNLPDGSEFKIVINE